MRKPYFARLADLQAQLIATSPQDSGLVIRQFLAHEASTTRNLRRANLLTPELLNLISTYNFSNLSGSLPYPPQYTLSTLYTITDHFLLVQIYDRQKNRVIYSQKTVVISPLC